MRSSGGVAVTKPGGADGRFDVAFPQDVSNCVVVASIAAQGGSMVNIDFRVLPGASTAETTVRLVDSVTPRGQGFTTELADEQGQFLLTAGIDRLAAHTGVSGNKARAASAATARRPAPPATARGN